MSYTRPKIFVRLNILSKKIIDEFDIKLIFIKDLYYNSNNFTLIVGDFLAKIINNILWKTKINKFNKNIYIMNILISYNSFLD